MDITFLAALTAGFLLIIALAEPIASFLRLPFAVTLCISGAILGVISNSLSEHQSLIDLEWSTRRMLEVDIPSELLLSIFVPILIFQAAIRLDVRRMQEDWLNIAFLSVVAVLVSTLVIGFSLSFSSILVNSGYLSVAVCFLAAAIISTTDPSAVIDIFKSISAPPRLVRLIQGESLINDATAIVLFSMFLAGVNLSGEEWNNLLISQNLTGQILYQLLGGTLIGWVFTMIAVPPLARISRWVEAQITMTLLLPFAVMIIAEYFGSSGIAAVFGAGVTLNLRKDVRLIPDNWKSIDDVWGIVAHWSGGLIFLMAALYIPRMLQDARLSDAILVSVAFLSALIARALMLWVVMPILVRMNISPPIENPFRIAILWGGLRGAATLALALVVIETPFIDPEIKRTVGIIATGYVLMVFVIQGLTLRPLISWLGLDRLTPEDEALSRQVVALARQDVREAVSAEIRDRGIDHEIIRAEAKALGEETQRAVEGVEEAEMILDGERVTLGFTALAKREKDIVLEAAEEGRISPELQARLASYADHIFEMTRAAGRSGYRRSVKRALGAGRALSVATWLHSNLRISRPLAALTAERIEVLIAQRAIVIDLHEFVDKRIRRLHGKRVTEILHDTLLKREERIADTLDGLHIQFPDYSKTIERRWIRSLAARLERQQYDVLYAENLITKEVRKELVNRLDREIQINKIRPKLDIGAQKDMLLRRLEILKDADDQLIRTLARRLHIIQVSPGEIVRRKEDRAGVIWLIGSGAFEVSGRGDPIKLGPGELFGHIVLLTKQHRPVEVRAATHGTLFRLSEKEFRDLYASNFEIRTAVLDRAERLGLNEADLII